MVLIIRSNDLESEPRVAKYVRFLEKENINYHLIGWDREEKNLKKNKRTYYRKKTGYNLRKKGIIYRVFWNFFLLKQFYIKRKDYRIIHACDFDTVLPSLVMKLFGKKVIFDIFDWFSDEVKTGNKFIDRIVNLLEKSAFKISDYVIICEEERKEQIGMKREDIKILPNIPDISKENIQIYSELESLIIKVSYVGGFYKGRGLEELVSVISKYPLKYQLDIAGYGDSYLTKIIEEYSKRYTNINYHGKVRYEKGLSIMGDSDLIYAMYYKINRNHIYAAPNKYYEAILLERPLITNLGTMLSKKIKKDDIGFVIEEGTSKLELLLNQIEKKEIEKKSKRIEKIWEKKYKNYVENFMKNEYLKILKEDV